MKLSRRGFRVGSINLIRKLTKNYILQFYDNTLNTIEANVGNPCIVDKFRLLRVINCYAPDIISNDVIHQGFICINNLHIIKSEGTMYL